MTTIAYDGEFVAVDSRETFNGIICSDSVDKTYIKEQGIFIMTGSTCECEKFADNFKDGEKTDIDHDTLGFMVKNGIVYMVGISDGKFWICKQSGQIYAIGSGGQFALAAMDHGRSAVAAVEYAMTRDCRSGGEVKFIHVTTGSRNF